MNDAAIVIAIVTLVSPIYFYLARLAYRVGILSEEIKFIKDIVLKLLRSFDNRGGLK